MAENKNIEVVIGCVIDGSKILLNKRIEQEIANIHEMWELPGGKIEPNESGEEAVVREIFEETGYKTKVIGSVPFHFNIERKSNRAILNVTLNCFICELVSKDAYMPRFEFKVGEIKWFEISEIQFLQIIAGSREFIYWILKKHCKIDFDNLRNPEFGFIYFENIDTINNHFKKYQITIQFTPNENDNSKLYCLSCHYGKIDRKETTINDFYPDEFSLHSELIKKVNDRINHGYNIIDHDNFPLKDWLKKHKDYIKPSKYKQFKFDF